MENYEQTSAMRPSHVQFIYSILMYTLQWFLLRFRLRLQLVVGHNNMAKLYSFKIIADAINCLHAKCDASLQPQLHATALRSQEA